MYVSLFRRIDYYLLIPLLLLSSFSLMVIYSTDKELAKQQLAFDLVGVLFLLGFSFFNYTLLKKISLPILAFLILILLAVLMFGPEVRGAHRWLDLGFVRLQPSEFAKVAIIVVLASYLSRVGGVKLRFKNIVVSAFLVIIPTLLIFLQPDLGTSITFIAVWGGLLFTSGLSIGVASVFISIGLISLPFIWPLLQSYQQNRILIFLNPNVDPLGDGYNVLQSVIAVGSGQLFGRGFGRGTQSHLRFLPEQHTDFIFATLAEEWGLIGVVILLTLLFLLILRIIVIANKSSNLFGLLLCMGVAYLFMTQLLINVGMNLGVMPVTGLPLPFISYGGSSVLAYMIALGLVHSVASRG